MNPARTISFPNGSKAEIVEASGDASGEELFVQLRLPTPRATLVVNGSTADLTAINRARVVDAVVNGIALAAAAQGLTVVTGGTDAGIFAVLGPAMARSSTPLVGVVPAHLVTWPGQHGSDDSPALLEPHHSHFVLVDGKEWGDETAALLALARALGARAPCAAVLCGGGAVARTEALGHSRAGRDLIAIAGSGRFADELAEAMRSADPPEDPDVAEMLAGGHVKICPLAVGGHHIADFLCAELLRDVH